MPTTVNSVALNGWGGDIVNVEAGIFRGLSEFSIVGLGGNVIQEAKKRIYSAIKNSPLRYPSAKKIINLGPANLKKQGTHYDLPIAIALLVASGQVPASAIQNTIFIGELGLDGTIKGVTGALALGEIAERNNFKLIFAPKQNKEELSLLKNIDVVNVSSLAEITAMLNGKTPRVIDKKADPKSLTLNSESLASPFLGIYGQSMAKRGCLIAAAGQHNILLIGSPGVGKTSIAESLIALLPPLTESERLEIIKISSLTGQKIDLNLPVRRPLVTLRQDSTAKTLIGNALGTKLGAVTLAHNGVLFLDELLEFRAQTLDLLRKPLDQQQAIAKPADSLPANFLLVAATNPCPCGLSLDSNEICGCSPAQIKRYKSRLSGALSDRIDLFVPMLHVPPTHITNDQEDCTDWNQRVLWTRQKQADRNKKFGKTLNSELNLNELNKIGSLSNAAKRTLLLAHDKMRLSMRGFLKIQRLARTIADLADENSVLEAHVLEALNFRLKI